MPIQLNQVVVIFFVWVFCLLEDKWFDKLLRYQIEGQAEKAGLSSNRAIDFYNNTKHRFIWTMLAVALTMILLSFHIDLVAVRVIIIAIGVIICFAYIFLKIIPYNKSSAVLYKR